METQSILEMRSAFIIDSSIRLCNQDIQYPANKILKNWRSTFPLEFLPHIVISIYFFTAFLLMLFGLNCYIMLFLFHRGMKGAETHRKNVRDRYANIMLRNDLRMSPHRYRCSTNTTW